MSADQRRVLLTPNIRAPSSNRVLEESTQVNLNHQSKKLEAYKAKWKASMQEKQQLQADHQRLLRRLKELEKKNLAKTQQNKHSTDSKDDHLNCPSNRARSSIASSTTLELERLGSVQLSRHVDFSPRRNSIGVIRSMDNLTDERFRDSSTTTTGFLDSFKILETAKQAKFTASCEDATSLQSDSNSKFLNASTDRRVNKLRFLNEEGEGEASQTLEALTLIKQELSVLSNRKKKLEQEVSHLKAELIREEERRWIVTDEHIEAQRKLRTVTANWNLFYDQLVQIFLPECRKFLSCLKRSEAACGSARRKQYNTTNHKVQEEQPNGSSIDRRNSHDVALVSENCIPNSARTFHSSGGQLDFLFLEPEIKSPFEGDILASPAVGSSPVNSFLCNQLLVRVICRKLLTNLKNLDSFESKLENVASKFENRIARLSATVSVLYGKNSLVRVPTECTPAIYPTSSENSFSLDVYFPENYCFYCNVSERNSAAPKNVLQNSRTASGICILEPLRKKVENLETKYGSLIARMLVQNDALPCLNNEQRGLKITQSLCFLNQLEVCLGLLEWSSNKHGSVLMRSGSTNFQAKEYQNDVCRAFDKNSTYSEVKHGRYSCIHCESLSQENRVLKERIAELEEENSSLADRIF
ncbi:hypothetical protein Gasu2_36410 [Galdieria sulphuraria]|nr:hypothetical protein Gasu2_36410 [Galdieria sulphuraria]